MSTSTESSKRLSKIESLSDIQLPFLISIFLASLTKFRLFIFIINYIEWFSYPPPIQSDSLCTIWRKTKFISKISLAIVLFMISHRMSWRQKIRENSTCAPRLLYTSQTIKTSLFKSLNSNQWKHCLSLVKYSLFSCWFNKV